ncbi:MAG: hypothetical protein K6E53_12855 [Lachnospiraceae bacterium]|nr:hypothetical protein [Lachnospiraceae bacterium]
MIVSLAACGRSSKKADRSAPDELTDIYITVDGTLIATVDCGQDAFIKQWEKAVSEKIGHDIRLHINQPEHSGYIDNVAQLLTAGKPGDGFTPVLGNGCVTYVKQSWLDEAGLKIEDIKTFDDYYNMLRAFTHGGRTGVIAAGFGKLD